MIGRDTEQQAVERDTKRPYIYAFTNERSLRIAQRSTCNLLFESEGWGDREIAACVADETGR